MVQLTPQSRIFLATEPVDFRKGRDGLAAVCRQRLGENPLEGAVYVFRNRSATALKLLLYDGQGYWLMMKRLSQGRFSGGPQTRDARVPPVRSRPPHVDVERRSRPSPDGSGLASRRLRRSPARGVGPGQPRSRVRHDLAAVFLQRHQVIQDLHTRVEASGDQTGDHTGDGGAVLRAKQQRVLALPNEKFQGAFHSMMLAGSTRYRSTSRQRAPVGLQISKGLA